MRQPDGTHLAEFNWGVLRHDWDDPRVADFVSGLDAVNAAGARMPGFVWRLDDDAMDAAQRDPAGPLGGNLRIASTLSVWESAQALATFVFSSIHRRFLDRGGEWFEESAGPRMVLWWSPRGHRPTVAEGVARIERLARDGDSDEAFGWGRLRGGAAALRPAPQRNETDYASPGATQRWSLTE